MPATTSNTPAHSSAIEGFAIHAFYREPGELSQSSGEEAKPLLQLDFCRPHVPIAEELDELTTGALVIKRHSKWPKCSKSYAPKNLLDVEKTS